jgi:UDP-GlcNAc3NAcA epimerase
MTDSGGLQKEAYFFNKQCITLRDQTEWVELVEYGVNFLVGAKKDEILNIYYSLNDFTRIFDRVNLYGAGNASSIITKNLMEFVG